MLLDDSVEMNNEAVKLFLYWRLHWSIKCDQGLSFSSCSNWAECDWDAGDSSTYPVSIFHLVPFTWHFNEQLTLWTLYSFVSCLTMEKYHISNGDHWNCSQVKCLWKKKKINFGEWNVILPCVASSGVVIWIFLVKYNTCRWGSKYGSVI